ATTTFDEENRKTVTTVDWLGRVARTDIYTGNGTATPYNVYASTSYQHDPLGRVISTTQNDNPHTTVGITYDSLGHKLQVIDPDTGTDTNPGTWSYRYDWDGNLIFQDD